MEVEVARHLRLLGLLHNPLHEPLFVHAKSTELLAEDLRGHLRRVSRLQLIGVELSATCLQLGEKMSEFVEIQHAVTVGVEDGYHCILEPKPLIITTLCNKQGFFNKKYLCRPGSGQGRPGPI